MTSPAADRAQPSPAPPAPTLPPVGEQAARLRALGVVPDHLDLDAAVARLAPLARDGDLLVLAARTAPPSALAPLMRRPARGRAGAAGEELAGFVVVDMTDVDEFAPTAAVTDLPDSDAYLVAAPDRGDDLRAWTPSEASGELVTRGRTPLTLSEGIQWVLQEPAVLTDNACFMTIGSRLAKQRGGFDARTPALWISGGTGRDGRERRGAAKVGWCWWNNFHTWLGFGSTAGRIA